MKMEKPFYKKAVFAFIFLLITFTPVISLFSQQKVAVLKSSDTDDFNAVRNGFMSVFFGEFEEFNCENDMNTAKRRMAIIKSDEFDVVLAIGTIAVTAALDANHGGLIIGTMVHNPDKLTAGSSNLTIIGMYPKLDILLGLIKSFNISNLGLLYNPDESNEFVERLKVAGQRQKVNIITQEANSPRVVPAVFQQLQGQIDAFLFMSDSIYSIKDSIDFILQTCLQNRIITIAPTHMLVTQGAVVSISADFVEIGRLSAQMVNDHFSGKRLPAFKEPDSLSVSYNQNTATSMGITIPAEIEREAKQVIR